MKPPSAKIRNQAQAIRMTLASDEKTTTSEVGRRASRGAVHFQASRGAGGEGEVAVGDAQATTG